MMATFTRRRHCEHCDELAHLAYHDPTDEYWCDNCITNAAEAQWERFCEAFHDGGSTQFKSLTEQQAEARKLK